MINFRYHLVSLVAVFLALSVGIVIGVTLRPTVDEGLAAQAEQDRKQVQALRTEISHRDQLDTYRDAYAAGAGPILTDGLLTGERVALVLMPGAPSSVTNAVSAAVVAAGGALTRTVKVNERTFDPARADSITETLSTFAADLALTDAMTPGEKVGRALGRSALTHEAGSSDEVGRTILRALTAAGLVSVDEDVDAPARLVIVIAGPTAVPAPDATIGQAHAAFDMALHAYAGGVVIAGPNSAGLDGTDVAAVRTGSTADSLSTVDVADLSSGVTTVILAGKEQLLGRQGDYGALGGADAPAPDLPVR